MLYNKSDYRVEGNKVYLKVKYKGALEEIILDKDKFDFLNENDLKLVIKNGGNKDRNLRVSISVSLQRWVMKDELKDNFKNIVDHVNRHTLDNSKDNLRLVTPSQNSCNVSKVRGKSKYKGVVWGVRQNKWKATIGKDYKQIHLGYFDTEKKAAIVRDIYTNKLHGNYANLNFPELKDKYDKITKFPLLNKEEGKQLKINNKTGMIGIFKRDSGSYYFELTINNKRYHFGGFYDLEEITFTRDIIVNKYYSKPIPSLNYPEYIDFYNLIKKDFSII